jgi:hypothetical protein
MDCADSFVTKSDSSSSTSTPFAAAPGFVFVRCFAVAVAFTVAFTTFAVCQVRGQWLVTIISLSGVAEESDETFGMGGVRHIRLEVDGELLADTEVLVQGHVPQRLILCPQCTPDVR